MLCLDLALGLGMMAACGQRPYRVFAVQVAGSPPPDPAPTPRPTVTSPAIAAKADPAASFAISAEVSQGELHARHPQWDLNRASAATLQQLPGIDAATVRALVAGRPYRAKRELLRRKILTPSQYARWKDYLVVHREATSAAKPRS